MTVLLLLLSEHAARVAAGGGPSSLSKLPEGQQQPLFMGAFKGQRTGAWASASSLAR